MENKEIITTIDETVKKNPAYSVNGVSYEDTAKLMFSDDYKENFIAEYVQTKIRYEKLHNLIIKHDAGTLDFNLTCPIIMLKNQKSSMGQYLNQLEIRAEIEKITLGV